MNINRTTILLTISVLVGIGIIGLVLLSLLRPDASATFVSQFATFMGFVTLAAGLGLQQVNTARKIETIQKQTNGNLSAEKRRNDQLVQTLMDNHIPLPPQEPDYYPPHRSDTAS